MINEKLINKISNNFDTEMEEPSSEPVNWFALLVANHCNSCDNGKYSPSNNTCSKSNEHPWSKKIQNWSMDPVKIIPFK